MGEINKPMREKLIAGYIFKDTEIYQKAKKAMAAGFGPVDYESPEFDFDFTEYYETEMGPGLKRRFVSFKKTVDPAALAGAKIFSDKIERRFFYPGTKNRQINIDPGLISQSKLVLATTKNFAHRIYIGKGIYAEVTLRYQKGCFTTLEWTYPDYATEKYQSALNEIREIYKKQMD
jgi:hypothetical protein